MLDIFKSDAFSVVNLTDAINNVKFVPGRLGQLGLFSSTGITTTSAAIEQKNGILSLVAPTPRGGPGSTLDKGKRTMLDIRVPHFEVNDAIMAEEVQGVRAFGQESALETVMDKVLERGGEISQSMDATSEYARIGAFKGIVTYADGSTLDLFSTFGVAQLAEVDFDLDNANPAEGALRKKCASVVRSIGDELGGVAFSGVIAQCGDAFFDDLMAHKEVRDSYKNTPMAEVLRQGYVFPNGQKISGAFEFGGIVWENYRGKVGNTSFVDTDKCHIAPLGVPGLFRTVWAPADYIETVNTKGKRLYSKLWPMPNGKGMNFDVQMNELSFCTRPRVLIKGKRT